MARLTKGRHNKLSSKKSDRPKYWFFFEGLTEWHYFNGFKKELRDVGVNLCMKKPTDGRGRVKLVEEAIRNIQHSGREKWDRVFVVSDVDAPCTQQELDKMFELARNNAIELFISNDAFELWPLLHFKNITSEMGREELEAELSKEIQKRFKKAYKKPCPDLFNMLSQDPDLVKQAISRAEALKNGQNPSTDIYKLVKLFMDFLRK